jgi:hypothetical protein
LKLNIFIILILGFTAAGCGYQLRENPQTSENAATANSNDKNINTANKNDSANSNTAKAGNAASEKDNADAGGKLVLTATSETGVYPCNGREVEIDENATANTFNLTGECKRLIVLGISNRVSVEKVGEVLVDGVSNKIVYGEGIDGKKPKITKKGVTNSVMQKGSEEEKKELESQ